MNVQTKVNSKSTDKRPLSKVICEVAVLASIRCSTLGMSRLDKAASKDSDRNHQARAGTGKVNVTRLPGAESAVDAIKKQQGQARLLLAQYTSQWGSDRRLLPNVNIGPFTGEFDVIQREHNRLVSEFVADATVYIAKAQQNLGSYEVAPPSQYEIENAFSLEFDLAPVPDVSAYTSAGDSALEKAMKQRFEDDVRFAYEGAQKDLFKRLAEPLENLVDRMKAYDERQRLKDKDIDVGKTGTFKSTVVSNIMDIAAVFRSFNLTNDPAMEAIAVRLEAFDGIEHEDLTKSQALRADVAKKAADIRGLLGAWLD